jgi:IS30 family transposase
VTLSLKKEPAVQSFRFSAQANNSAPKAVGSSIKPSCIILSKLNLVKHVPSKHADVVTKVIITVLKPYQLDLLTIKFDNGKEFAFHDEIKKALNVDTYFAHPYSSWERGFNENHNGLIRQYWSKNEPLDKVTDKQILDIQNRLNQRPRKMLGFKTPNEIYSEMALVA